MNYELEIMNFYSRGKVKKFFAYAQDESLLSCLLDLKYCLSERNAVERRIFLIEIRFPQKAVIRNYKRKQIPAFTHNS
jgi:hypothetical protein